MSPSEAWVLKNCQLSSEYLKPGPTHICYIAGQCYLHGEVE